MGNRNKTTATVLSRAEQLRFTCRAESRYAMTLANMRKNGVCAIRARN